MIAESHSSISLPLSEAVEARVGDELPATLDPQRAAGYREGWQQLIDYRLIEWDLNPDEFEAEGMVPPVRRTLRLAIDVAQVLGRAGEPPPTRVVPDAHGGIVFERQEGNVLETIRIGADERVEHCRFSGGKLTGRKRWQVHSLAASE